MQPAVLYWFLKLKLGTTTRRWLNILLAQLPCQLARKMQTPLTPALTMMWNMRTFCLSILIVILPSIMFVNGAYWGETLCEFNWYYLLGREFYWVGSEWWLGLRVAFPWLSTYNPSLCPLSRLCTILCNGGTWHWSLIILLLSINTIIFISRGTNQSKPQFAAHKWFLLTADNMQHTAMRNLHTKYLQG